MEPLSALPLIPQRPPFTLVDYLVDCHGNSCTTTYTIPDEHLLVTEGTLSACGLIENMAQTCAVRIGYLNREKPVRIGVVGSISNFKAYRLPACGETLHTKVEVVAEVFDAVVVHAAATVNGTKAAECDLKVFLV